METLLDYINEKDSRELDVATYKQMYDNFCIKYPKQLVSITANKGTTVYEAGSTINTNDVVVTAYYNDGSTEEITSGITVDLTNVDTSTIGDYYASVTWSEKTVYVPITIYSTDDRVVLYSGKDGNYITWELYNDGTMELTNTASWKCAISNYADGEQPWYDYMNMIKKVKINAGNYVIGTIGEYAFYGATNLTELDFSEINGTVNLYGNAFGNCGFTTPTIENVSSVATGTFSGCPITEITLGANSLTYNTFIGCNDLAIVRLTNETMSIDGGAFEANKATITDIYVAWEEGAVIAAPWGAANATIHYNTTT